MIYKVSMYDADLYDSHEAAEKEGAVLTVEHWSDKPMEMSEKINLTATLSRGILHFSSKKVMIAVFEKK